MSAKVLLLGITLGLFAGCGGVDETPILEEARTPAGLISAAGTLRGGPFTMRAELGRPLPIRSLSTNSTNQE